MAEPVAYGLIGDPSLTRAAMIPVGRRTFTDPGDDITEELGGLELATPGLLHDPLMGMASTGAMLMGDMPVNPNVMTQTMLDAPLVGGLLSAATGAAPKGTLLGANVFHGGPHRWSPEPDFPHGRPRLDKIGTGEGAQAYGYGFYSAEAPGVAQTYKTPEGSYQRLTGQMDPKTEFAFDLMEKGQSASKIMEMMLGKYGDNITFDEAVKAIDGARDIGAGQGTLYKLDIPDADVAKYLDWDKPLSEQGERVRDFAAHAFAREAGVNPSHKNYAAMVDTIRRQMDDTGKTGEDFYRALANVHGSDQAASEALRKAGIPGLKYFDQDSRTRTARATIDGVSINKYEPQNGYEEYIIDKFKSGVPFHEIEKIAAMRPEGDALLAKWKLKVPEGTRNYVTWDQDVLDRSKMLERDGVTLGANKAPTAALPSLLDDTASRISSSFSRDKDAIGVVSDQMDDYANVTTTMTPSRYLNLAKPIGKLTESDKETIKYFEKVFREQSDKTVANPWLDITWDKSAGKWDVTQHEGRHRMIAAKNVFGPDAEIPVQLFPKQEGAGKIPIKALNDPRQMAFYGLDQNTAAQMKTALGQRFGMEGLPFILGANKAPTAALPGLLQDRRRKPGRTPRKPDEFPIFGLLGQRLYTATAPDGSI